MAIIQDGTRWFSVNFTPTSGSGSLTLLWEWAQVLAAAGWTYVQTGNGTAKTAGTPGANPFVVATTGWVQMRAPTGTAEVTIQRDSAQDYSVRAYFSMVGFGGTGTASAPPAAPSDKIQIIGAGDAYDSGGFVWGSLNAANYKWNICADSAPHRGFYYFHIIGRVVTSGGGYRRVIFDTVESNADGTVGNADVAPFIIYAAGGTTMPGHTTASAIGWYKKGLAGEALDTAIVLSRGGWETNDIGASPYMGVHEKIKPLLFKTGTNIQTKGHAHTLRFFSDASLAVYDTTDLATAGEAMVHFENKLLVPWPSTVAPVP